MKSNFKNGCKNEFQDDNEKSCSWFKNKVPQKIDFRADGTHESHPTAWELNEDKKPMSGQKYNNGPKRYHSTSNSPKLWELITSVRPKFTRVSRWNSQKNNYNYFYLTKAIFAFATSRSVKNWHKRTKVERQIVPLNTTWI